MPIYTYDFKHSGGEGSGSIIAKNKTEAKENVKELINYGRAKDDLVKKVTVNVREVPTVEIPETPEE